MDKLPKGWTSKPIEKLFKIKSGNFIPKSESVSDGKYFIYGGNGILGKHHLFNLSGENIIIGRVGAKCGNVRLVNDQIWLSDNAFYISQYLFEVENKYLKIFLEYIDLGKTANQAAQPVISFKSIKDIIVPLPPLSEQTRIVSKLDALFARLDKSITLLEENIKYTKGLMASVLENIFSENNWHESYVNDIITLYNGRAYKQEELLKSGKYKVIRIQNLNGGSNFYYSDLELDSNKYCEKGDLLYSWSGTPGTSFGAFVWNDTKAIFHYHIWKIEIKGKDNPIFILYALKYLTIKAIESSHGGTGMMHITKEKMEKLKIKVPDLKSQLYISNKLTQLYKITDETIIGQQSKLTYLIALKSSILDRAFKGQL